MVGTRHDTLSEDTAPLRWEARTLRWTALLGLGLLLATVWLLLTFRWQAGSHPEGDEGSWMSMAAQLARGEGFTTRWLEHHWLRPYDLPRPDDFRYPAYSMWLAAAFALFSFDYAIALQATAALYLVFLAAFAVCVRRLWGWRTAWVALPLVSFSLLQMHWNSRVYTEGLFALGLAVWLLASRQASTATDRGAFRIRPWIAVGFSMGFLYLVRPNALLLLGGVATLGLRALIHRTSGEPPWRELRPAMAISAGWLAMTLPWLIRSQILFGSPFHIAGSAGLLRDGIGQSHTEGLWSFLSRHSPLYPLQHLLEGTADFLIYLHDFEHGLEIAPLCLATLRIFFWVRRKFRLARKQGNPWTGTWKAFSTFEILTLGAFLPSLAACAYASRDSWAGVRYASPFLPYVYAFGLASLFPLLRRWRPSFLSQRDPTRSSRPRTAPLHRGRVRFLAMTLVWTLIGLALTAPTLQAHRYYVRRFADSDAWKRRIEAEHSHASILSETLSPSDSYYAKDACQLNFMTTLRCVGLQELYDSTWFPRSEAVFQPAFIALGKSESDDEDLAQARKRFREHGYLLDTVAQTPLAWIARIRRPQGTP